MTIASWFVNLDGLFERYPDEMQRALNRISRQARRGPRYVRVGARCPDGEGEFDGDGHQCLLCGEPIEAHGRTFAIDLDEGTQVDTRTGRICEIARLADAAPEPHIRLLRDVLPSCRVTRSKDARAAVARAPAHEMSRIDLRCGASSSVLAGALVWFTGQPRTLSQASLRMIVARAGGTYIGTPPRREAALIIVRGVDPEDGRGLVNSLQLHRTLVRHPSCICLDEHGFVDLVGGDHDNALRAWCAETTPYKDRRALARMLDTTPSGSPPLPQSLARHVCAGRAFGLRWRDLGRRRPAGTALRNSRLARALQTKQQFTQKEWEAFDIQHLKRDHHVLSRGSYFGPIDCDSSDAQTLGEAMRIADETETEQRRWMHLCGATPAMVHALASSRLQGWPSEATRSQCLANGVPRSMLRHADLCALSPVSRDRESVRRLLNSSCDNELIASQDDRRLTWIIDARKRSLDDACAELAVRYGVCARRAARIDNEPAATTVVMERNPTSATTVRWWEDESETLRLAPMDKTDRRRFVAEYPRDPVEIERLCNSTRTLIRIRDDPQVYRNQARDFMSQFDEAPNIVEIDRTTRERTMGLQCSPGWTSKGSTPRSHLTLEIVRLAIARDEEEAEIARYFATESETTIRNTKREAAEMGWVLTERGLYDAFPISEARRIPFARIVIGTF